MQGQSPYHYEPSLQRLQRTGGADLQNEDHRRTFQLKPRDEEGKTVGHEHTERHPEGGTSEGQKRALRKAEARRRYQEVS